VPRPSLALIFGGWACGGAALYAVGALVSPLAGLALLVLLTIAIVVTVGPTAHFILAKRAVAAGSYNPLITAAKVAGGIAGLVTVLALLGLFNFA
jgi:hypothetical protein